MIRLAPALWRSSQRKLGFDTSDMAKCCQQYPTANNHSLGLPTSMSFCRSSSSSCPSAVWMPGPAHGAFKGYIEYICSRVLCSKETVSKYYPDLSSTGTPRMIQLKFMTSKVLKDPCTTACGSLTQPMELLDWSCLAGQMPFFPQKNMGQESNSTESQVQENIVISI